MADPPNTRQAPVGWLIIVGALLIPWSCLVNLWFAPNELYQPLLRLSKGLIYPAMQVALPTLLIFLLAQRAVGMRPRDVGLRARDFWRGVLATLLLWGLLHVAAWPLLDAQWRWSSLLSETPTYWIGKSLAQLLGNAAFEEVIYRGLFLTQILLILKARGLSSKRAAWSAALLSALIFALPHIPNRIDKGAYEGFGDVLIDQLRLVVSGMFLAWVYLRSRNLWWLIGLHSLANVPSFLFQVEKESGGKLIVSVIGLILTIAWPWVFRERLETAESPPDDQSPV